MTKKEYILDFLKEINYAYNHPAMYDDLKRLLDEMEEEILESANCINREEVLNECISRDKAIVQLSHLLSDWDDDWNVPIRKCIETIKIVPSVSPQQKVGHWVKVIEENGHSFYLCSVCKEGTDENYDWCPNCGSRNGGKK